MDARLPRVAHVVDSPSKSTDHPVVSDKDTRLPIILRQHAADKFFEILTDRMPKEEASKQALELELQLYSGCKKKNVYKNNLLNKLTSLKTPRSSPVKVPVLRFDQMAERLEDLLIPESILLELGFPCLTQSQRVERLLEQEVECSRCRTPFIPDLYYQMEAPEECRYHHGRLQSIKNHKNRVYSCCHAEADGISCTTAPRHVYLSKQLCTEDLLVSTESDYLQASSQVDLLAIDGEMCHTERGLELCRLTAVSWDEERLLDVLIHPSSTIVDYNTRFSGLSAASFEPGAFNIIVPEGIDPRIFTMHELHSQVLPTLIGPHTFLVGHSLENDLFHLKLDHKRIIDTTILYPHNKGRPYRMALRDLSRVHLKQFVQEGSAGHDSYEDCVACLRLLKLKL